MFDQRAAADERHNRGRTLRTRPRPSLDEGIASTLRTVEHLRRRLDIDAGLVAQVEQRRLDNAVKLSTP
ncbi:hypothetical protein F8M49_04475 [Rhodococcus zopfii]|uniref:Uncharacterized protein n=1 Tax=Rhodococcus zopfii TaxID=43772 RepID=A0ABU3WLI6_9NOCA|nr:hypothetical protein [Rhodococcus zopfii]